MSQKICRKTLIFCENLNNGDSCGRTLIKSPEKFIIKYSKYKIYVYQSIKRFLNYPLHKYKTSYHPMTFDNLIGNSISRIVHWKLSPVDEKIHLEVKIWKVFSWSLKLLKCVDTKKARDRPTEVNLGKYYYILWQLKTGCKSCSPFYYVTG